MEMVSELSLFGNMISGPSFVLDSNELVKRLGYFEKWLHEARFVKSPEEYVRCIEQDDRIQFHLYRRWSRKPMRIPALIIESRMVISHVSTVEFVIQRSEDNFVVVAIAPSDAIGSYQYTTHVQLDTRHDDVFSLALRHNGIRPGKVVLNHVCTIDFLHSVFAKI